MCIIYTLMNNLSLQQGGNVKVTPAGAIIASGATENEIESLMIEAAAADRSCRFVLGDLINHASEKHGEKYQRWIELTGMDYGTLRNIASVCPRVKIDSRNPALTFEHHRFVAKLEEPKQEEWLGNAEESGLTVRALKKSIELGRIATEDELKSQNKTQDGWETFHPWVTRIIVLYGKMKREGELDSLDANQLLDLLEDLAPVAERVAEVAEQLSKSGDEEKQQAKDLLEEIGLKLS